MQFQTPKFIDSRPWPQCYKSEDSLSCLQVPGLVQNRSTLVCTHLLCHKMMPRARWGLLFANSFWPEDGQGPWQGLKPPHVSSGVPQRPHCHSGTNPTKASTTETTKHTGPIFLHGQWKWNVPGFEPSHVQLEEGPENVFCILQSLVGENIMDSNHLRGCIQAMGPSKVAPAPVDTERAMKCISALSSLCHTSPQT